MKAINDYTTRALSCEAEEAETLADELQAELDSADGLPALVVELRKVLRTSLATADWLESIGDSEGATRLRDKAAHELQPQINNAESGALDARVSLRILCGSVWEARAADSVHTLYCAAVEIAHGKGSIGGFTKRCNAFYASLQHKSAKAENEGLGTSGNGEWFSLSYLNGAAYAASLRLQMEAIPACERRATLTLDAPSEIPASLWLWIREQKELGIVQGLPGCSLGNVESLRVAFGRARVLHNAVGSVAINKGEKAKAKVYYEHDLHPYADRDSTMAQAYVHDETGARVIAPFPKRPVVSMKNSKRRATVENVPKGSMQTTTGLQSTPTREPAKMSDYDWNWELMIRRKKFIDHAPTRFYRDVIAHK